MVALAAGSRYNVMITAGPVERDRVQDFWVLLYDFMYIPRCFLFVTCVVTLNYLPFCGVLPFRWPSHVLYCVLTDGCDVEKLIF
jgi:hypothetical protein